PPAAVRTDGPPTKVLVPPRVDGVGRCGLSMRRERPRHGLNRNDDRKQEREHNPRLHGEQPRFPRKSYAEPRDRLTAGPPVSVRRDETFRRTSGRTHSAQLEPAKCAVEFAAMQPRRVIDDLRA